MPRSGAISANRTTMVAARIWIQSIGWRVMAMRPARGGEWIRPRWDHLLQADALPGVEVDLPDADWFAQRALRLAPVLRHQLATHLTFAGWDVQSDVQDGSWLGGEGKMLLWA